MSIKQIFSTIGAGVLDTFFPTDCPVCGKPLPKAEGLCPDCLKALPRTEQSWLRDNSTEQLFIGSSSRFDRGASFLFFDKGSTVQDLILKIKFSDRADLGYLLGKVAAQEFLQTDFFEDIDVLIPVPLHPKRYRERGYNQAEWIARGIHEVTGIPLDTEHIFRTRNNAHQASLKEKERIANVHRLFSVRRPEELFEKHILLIDDVVTTGSTMLACIHALQHVRGSKVSVFALARPRN